MAAQAISLSDHLLGSRIILPPDPCVLYTRLAPLPAANTLNAKPLHHLQAFELARRSLLSRNKESLAPLLESFLSSIDVAQSSPAMHVFTVSAQDAVTDAMCKLRDLHFEGLSIEPPAYFALKHIYPCSPSCADSLDPCAECLSQSSPSSSKAAPCTRLPRKPLRSPYSHFLEAIRLRLLDDIATAATCTSHPRYVRRLKGGFLLGPPLDAGAGAGGWAESWEHRARARPLLHVDLQIHLSMASSNSNRVPNLVIHPLPHPTPLIPLPHALSTIPLLPQGTPIILLPHGTPAFFLVSYTGSTSALTNQFRETLRGTGMGSWDCTTATSSPSSTSHAASSTSSTSTSHPSSATHTHAASNVPQYIIAWINVSNPHGEDKGLLVVYPASLCAVCIPIPPPETPERLPQLPGPLVASPVVGATVPVGGTASMAASIAHVPYLGPVSAPSSSMATTSIPMPIPEPQPQPAPATFATSAALLPIPSSPSSDSTRLFSALTLHRTRPLRDTVAEVGRYVDEVARERERERERLREEREKTRVREGGAMVSPKLSRTSTGTGGGGSSMDAVNAPAAPATAAPVPLPIIADPSQAVAGPSQPPTGQQQQQSFYPSPPQTNPTMAPPAAAATEVAIVAPVDLTPTPTPQPSQQPTSGSTPAPSASVSNAPPPAQPYDDAASAWPQPYLDMDFAMLDMDMSNINMDMDMGMNIGMGFGGSAGGFGSSLGIGSSSGDGGAFGGASAFGSASGGDGGFEGAAGGMNMASTTGNGSGGFGSGGGDLGMGGMGDFDDSAFTDDDFSFFDRPSTTSMPVAAAPGVPGAIQQQMQSAVTMHGPPQERQQPPPPQHTHQIPTPHSHVSIGSPWVHTTPQAHPHPHSHPNAHSGLNPHPHPNLDGNGHPTPTLTLNVISNISSPHVLAHDSSVHTLLPPTPPSATFSPVLFTPFPHPSPLTPGVHLHTSHAPHSPATGRPGGGIFDPIPFAPYHRTLDGKYAVGKFALPSPPEEREDERSEDRWGGKGLGLGAPYVYIPKPSIKVVKGAKTGDVDFAVEASAGGKAIAGVRSGSNANSADSDGDGGGGGDGNGGERGWRDKYIAATDPRIGVVRKLIGVKRKMDFTHDQGGRRGGGGSRTASAKTKTAVLAKSKGLMSPSWIREHEDWNANAATPRGVSEKDEEEEDDSDLDMDADAPSSATTPTISRPSTPPPPYLPPGPTLLPTMFDHAALLAMSTPLRAPAHLHHLHIGLGMGTGVSSTHAQATSVPTPVSPAAVFGAATEKSKSLEAAAYTVASEVVENPTWAEAWRASTLAGGVRAPSEVWVGDVRFVGRLLGNVVSAQGSLEVGEVFVCLESGKGKGKETGEGESEKPQSSEKSLAENQQKHLRVMEAPLISVGKGDAVIRILPTALRFWGKLGLGPRGGNKNGTAFVLFEDGSEHRQEQVEAWLSTVVATYEGMHLGTLVPGKSPANPRAGVYPVRFDSSFRKSLASLMSNLPSSSSSLIFFIVTPLSTLTLASPVLRQVLSAVRKATKTYSEAQVHFHFVAEQLIHSTRCKSTSMFTDLELLCASVYNRILVPVDRLMSRRFFEFGERIRKYFQEPALTLARPMYSKVSFVRAPHASLDVVDRGTFLHIGYLVSPCGKWILAACVDQRGEAYELGVWLTQTPADGDSDEVSDEMFIVRKIWDFAIQFAKKANVEWRIVVSRLGVLTEAELDAWATWIDTKSRTVRMTSITVLSVESEAPWMFCSTTPPPQSPPSKVANPTRSASTSRGHPQNIFTDISSIIYAVSPYDPLPQSRPPTLADLGLISSLVSEPTCSSIPGFEQQNQSLSLPHHLCLRPRCSTTLICIPNVPSPTAISMLHLHMLHTTRPSPSTNAENIPSLQSAITRNFYELAILARSRCLGVSPLLPFHLGAVEAMRIALGRDQYALDITDGTS